MDDVNERFNELMADLNLEAPSDCVTVSVLDDLELNRRLHAVKQELLDLKETMSPRTQRGRDLHSERAAFIIELRKRGLM